jgi:hypothetical protein
MVKSRDTAPLLLTCRGWHNPFFLYVVSQQHQRISNVEESSQNLPDFQDAPRIELLYILEMKEIS